MHKLSVHKIPVVSSESVSPGSATSPSTRGIISVPHPRSSDAVIYFDVRQQELGILNKTSGEKACTHHVDCHQDPITPGPIAVHEKGRRVLLLCRGTRFADNQLLEIDLESGEQTIRHRYNGPGWLMGQFLKDEVIIFEQRLGDEPTFVVKKGESTIWESSGTQPMVLPQIWSDQFIIMLACLNPNPLTRTGPTQLCALDINSSAMFPLSSIEGQRLSIDRNVIRVENLNNNAHDFALELKADS